MLTSAAGTLASLFLLMLGVSPGEAAQLRLTWADNSVDEDGFKVERRVLPGGQFQHVALVGRDVTTYDDGGLMPGVQYCYRVRAFNGAGDSASSNEDCETAVALGQSEPRVFTGPGSGGGPHVRGFTPNGSATPSPDFFAYSAGFTGGVVVASATLQTVQHLVTAPGPGGGPHVRVLNLDGTPTGIEFMAYDPGFTGGVRIAAGDVDGDGEAEIVTAPGPGGGPHIRVWKVVGTAVHELVGFFAFAPEFAGGVFVAAADVDGDNRAEIITAAGAGGAPHVRVWKVAGSQVVEMGAGGFFAYHPSFTGGVFVAAGKLGAGTADIVTGAGAGGGPHVRVWRLAGGLFAEVAGFFAYAPGFVGEVRVAVGDLDANGGGKIVTGAGPGGGPHVQTFSLVGNAVVGGASFFAFDPGFLGGVFVAAVP